MKSFPRSSRVIRSFPGVFLSMGLAVFACTGSGAPPKAPPVVRTDAAGVPIVPILSGYKVMEVCRVLPATGNRADYSGITVRSEDSSGVVLWLVDDKARRIEDSIYSLTLQPSFRRTAPPIDVTPARVPVSNTAGISTGGDIEDLGWLAPADSMPGVLAVSGEVGPGEMPASWFYILQPEGTGLRLVRAGLGSPPGEEIGNNGFEGVGVRRGAPGVVEVYLFKERPAPLYARLYFLTLQSGDYATSSALPDTIFEMPGFTTQSGAAFRPDGRSVLVIDRQRRLIGDMQTLPGGHGLLPRPRSWIDYAAVDSLIENRDDETPPSLFGVAEGITEDSAGRLYILSDNNETGDSKLLILAPGKGSAPASPRK